MKPPRFRSLIAIMSSLIVASSVVAQPGPSGKHNGDRNVLVFSRTQGFRHASIENGAAALTAIGSANGFGTTHTEDPTMFSDMALQGFDAVVFLNTTGDVLDASQQEALQRFIRSGKGFVGIHSAADTEYDWEWYGRLVGAYFQSHPNNPNVRDGKVLVVDRRHPSTSVLPERWPRTDEWYNYGSNPRGNVHVLMTLDETSYSGGTMGADHPIAWCHDFEGGRAWYTGGGHTEAAFDEPDFRKHLLGGIRYAVGEGGDCSGTVWGNFEKVVLDEAAWNPIDLAVADDGRVLFVEKAGAVKVYDPGMQRVTLAGRLDVFDQFEDGLIGVELDPDFSNNGWIYLYHSPTAESVNRLSRFEIAGSALDMESEVVLLDVPVQRVSCCHAAGSMAFDAAGNLYLATGDNTNPFESSGFAPIDERPGRAPWDAQGSAGNTADLRGAILRIHPEPDGSYSIPDGNLFPADGSAGAPEIYAMGLRNPFRISVDPVSGALYWGDVGPDARASSPTRGPVGYDEWNRTLSAGNFGWPYCIADNIPYVDYDFATGLSGGPFDCDDPVNDSPNNTGAETLPPAEPAWIWYPYGVSPDFPGVGAGSGRTAMAGPTYNLSQVSGDDDVFPAYYDGTLFVYEWSRDWIAEVKVAGDGSPLAILPFMPGETWTRPIAMEMGLDGSLYVLEWGSGFGGDNLDSRLSRITFAGGDKHPIVEAVAEPTSGPIPLTVSFSAEGSFDPDPGDFLTFEWDFESDGIVDASGEVVEHTYFEAGDFEARLTARDVTGNETVRTWMIGAGNTAPVVSIRRPVNGGFYKPGHPVAFEVSVEDVEDGSTAAGTIDCAAVEFQLFIGHSEHSHPLEQFESCEGSFVPVAHGEPGEDLFYVVEATYSDRGVEGVVGPATSRTLHILQPERKEAEYFDGTNGVLLEPATDPLGGNQNLAYIDDGDWVRYDNVNLQGINFITFRVASAGSGGTIAVRADDVNGPLLGMTGVHVTGGWQEWTDVTAAIDPPANMSSLYLVFSGVGGGLFNVNSFRTHGPGVTEVDTSAGQTGLLAEYFNSVDLRGEPITRIDPGISFNWGRRSPMAGLRGNLFSVRWSGSVTPVVGGTYRFHVDTDSGVRFWLDGKPLVDVWETPSDGEVASGPILLEAGRRYDLLLEYFEQTADARVILRWSSTSVPKQIIDQDLLSPEREIQLSSPESQLPVAFALRGAYPNPFRSHFAIGIDAPERARARIALFDPSGRLVARLIDEAIDAGRHTFRFELGDLPSGLYLVRISAADWSASTGIVRIK